MNRYNPYSFNQGFTLVEMMVAVSIIAILGSIGIPAFNNMLLSHRMATESNLFLTALHLARTESIKRNGRVVVCKSVSGDACAEEGNWQQGWIIFVDTNNNANIDNDETLLRREHALPAGFALTGNAPVARYISYTSLGMTKLISGAFQAGTLTLCHQNISVGEARQIIINMSGRPRVQRVTISSCPL